MARTLDNLIRLQRWRLDERRREMGQVLERRETLHQQQTALEERYAREVALLRDSNDPLLAMGLPGYQQKYAQARDQYARAIAQADKQVETLRERIAEEFKAMKSYEQVRDRRQEEERLAAERLEQQQLDDIAGMRHARGFSTPGDTG